MIGRAVCVALLVAVAPSGAVAKDTRFWNLTANTITSLRLSPAGRKEWGPNQTDNDSDRSVDHDERLRIAGVTSGAYDVKILDKSGRSCLVSNVQIKEGSVFTIEEKDLRDCSK